MNQHNIKFTINSASETQIFMHLQVCKGSFIPPLNETVNISDYSKKIIENATIFEAWKEEILVAFIAAYFNDDAKQKAYITNVSTLKDYTGLGIAKDLLSMCVKYAEDEKYKVIGLQVNKTNIPAIKLYEKYNFTETKDLNEFIEMELEICSKKKSDK